MNIYADSVNKLLLNIKIEASKTLNFHLEKRKSKTGETELLKSKK